MIATTQLRTLHVSSDGLDTRSSYISAASGLVQVGSNLYVVSDDEYHLALFSADVTEPGKLIRLFPGDLPPLKAERKLKKPDLEAIVFVPAFEGFSHGAVMALGSASRPNRGRGVLLGMDRQGAVTGSAAQVEMEPLLGTLRQIFPKLNIEGAAVVGDALLLFQRGNKGGADNAIIHYPLLPVLETLRGRDTTILEPSAITRMDLGTVDGIPLCFTDAATLPSGEVVFSAVAEDTDDAYVDGQCVGAAIGIIDTTGRLLSVRRLEHPHKVEGVSAELKNGTLDLLLVTDADDPLIPAKLLSASFRM